MPAALTEVKESGGCGGVEFAFMSTTTSKEVAISYIGGKDLPVLLEMAVGDIDRGCSLSHMSQYPGEVCMCVRMFVSKHVCMCVCVCIYIYCTCMYECMFLLFLAC